MKLIHKQSLRLAGATAAVPTFPQAQVKRGIGLSQVLGGAMALCIASPLPEVSVAAVFLAAATFTAHAQDTEVRVPPRKTRVTQDLRPHHRKRAQRAPSDSGDEATIPRLPDYFRNCEHPAPRLCNDNYWPVRAANGATGDTETISEALTGRPCRQSSRPAPRLAASAALDACYRSTVGNIYNEIHLKIEAPATADCPFPFPASGVTLIAGRPQKPAAGAGRWRPLWANSRHHALFRRRGKLV
jgi:hypothetical protein